MAHRAGVGEIEDAHFLLLTQSPGALACLGQQNQVLGHLKPDDAVHNLQVESLADAAIADDGLLVATLDRRDDRVLQSSASTISGSFQRVC